MQYINLDTILRDAEKRSVRSWSRDAPFLTQVERRRILQKTAWVNNQLYLRFTFLVRLGLSV